MLGLILFGFCKALDIYVRKMRDPDAAERYCDAAYNENEDRKDAYMSLLKVYLEEPIMLEPALSLLTKHVDRIKAVEALELLPKSTPIKSVLPFFRAVLSQSCESRHESQVRDQWFFCVCVCVCVCFGSQFV